MLWIYHKYVCARSFQSYLTLCDSMDYSPLGSSVHGILQARILERGCHALLQGIFPTQESNPSLKLPSLAGKFFTTSTTREVYIYNRGRVKRVY